MEMEQQLIDEEENKPKTYYLGCCTPIPRSVGGPSDMLCVGWFRVITTLSAYFVLSVAASQLFGVECEKENETPLIVARWGILLSGLLIGVSLVGSMLALLKIERPNPEKAARAAKFQQFLEKSGVKMAIIRVYTQLYLEAEEPKDPIQYIIEKLGGIRNTEEVDLLKKEVGVLTQRITELEQENVKHRGEVKINLEELNSQKI